jgi:hypothetical protein
MLNAPNTPIIVQKVDLDLDPTRMRTQHPSGGRYTTNKYCWYYNGVKNSLLWPGHRIKVDFKMYNYSLPFESEHILRIKILHVL